MTREKVDKMALIVAARFNTFDAAEAAASQLMAAGVTADDLFTFFVNPADKPGPHPAEDPASGGAWIGAAVTGLVGAVIGALIGSVFGLTAISIVGGAGVGAYVGSLAGALRTLGRQRPPRSPVGGAAPPAANAGRPSGVLLAVHVQAQDEQRIAHLLRDAGGQEVERAQGRWEDGKWQDFDPLGSPDMKRDL